MKTLLASGLLVFTAAPLSGQAPVRQHLRAGVLDSRIELDGKLVDSAWARADSINGLTQVTPVEGGPAQSRTVVKVLVNAREILFGIVAYGAPDVPITSFSKARDADLSGEDYIQIVIDGFQDGRSGYVFSVNPSGARFDGLPVRLGEGTDASWDGIWEAATFQDGNTWSAEIRIPVRTVIFRPGLDAWDSMSSARSKPPRRSPAGPIRRRTSGSPKPAGPACWKDSRTSRSAWDSACARRCPAGAAIPVPGRHSTGPSSLRWTFPSGLARTCSPR